LKSLSLSLSLSVSLSKILNRREMMTELKRNADSFLSNDSQVLDQGMCNLYLLSSIYNVTICLQTKLLIFLFVVRRIVIISHVLENFIVSHNRSDTVVDWIVWSPSHQLHLYNYITQPRGFSCESKPDTNFTCVCHPEEGLFNSKCRSSRKWSGETKGI